MKKALYKTELFFTQLGQRLLPYFSPAIVSTLMVLFVAILLFFLPNYAGIADNGSFSKLVNYSGLYPLKGYEQLYTNYFVREYGILEYFNETGIHWVSSQSIFLQGAILINKIFYSKTIFDLRFLAGLYLVFYLGAIYLLTQALTQNSRTKISYLIAIMIGFIFADSAYLINFQSLYPNAIALISFIYMFAAGILFYRRIYADKWLLLIYATSAFFLLTLGVQYLLAVAFSLIIIIIIGFMNANASIRLLTLFSVLFLLISGVLTYLFLPLSEAEDRHFQAVSQGVSIIAGQPDQAVEKMAINPQYGLIRGDNYFDQYLPYDSKGSDVKNNLVKKANSLRLVTYYFLNPKELKKALRKSMATIYTIQEVSLGNFEKSAGQAPGAKTNLFSFYSKLRQKYFPKTLGFFILFTLIMLALYVPSFIKSVQEKERREGIRLLVVVVFFLMAWSDLLIVTMTFGLNGISPHLLLVPLSFDLLILLTVSEMLNRRLFKTKLELAKQENKEEQNHEEA